jgi:hypothetical protein
MRTVFRLAVWALAAAGAAYAADASWVWLRATARGAPTRTVRIHLMLAVPQKGNRVEYIPGGTTTESCVVALFPHAGLAPCWYLERHTRREVDY